MALSENDRAKLDRLGIENVKLKLTDAEPGPQSAVPGLGPDLDVARRHRRMAFRTIPQGRQTTRRYSLVGEGGYMGRRYRFRGCGHRDRDRGRNRDYRTKRVTSRPIHARPPLPASDQMRGSPISAKIRWRGASESVCLSAVGPRSTAPGGSDTQRCRVRVPGTRRRGTYGDKAKPPVF